MGTELEWKLAVPEIALLDQIAAWEPLQPLLAEPFREYEMRTTYYDTPDRKFADRHMTVRCRRENGEAVVCVKAPLPEAGDPSLHGEWETAGEDPLQALPELVAAGAPRMLLEAEVLRPVCRAAFHRRAVLLRFPDASVCELALDCGALFGAAEEEPLCELELEMKAGDPAAARALYAGLSARFGLEPQPLSKYARAKALG